MQKMHHAMCICLLLGLPALTCGLLLPGPNPTKVASAIFATQTTSARTATAAPTPTPTSTPTPAPIHLQADGSGDYPTLAEAVQHAPEGTTVILGPGTFLLDKPLHVYRSIHLVGTGMDETEIISVGEEYVVLFSGDGPFTAEDITFRHSGRQAADVVVVRRGEFTFTRCRFTGAARDRWETIRSGLRLTGNTNGSVRDCLAVGNDSAGILVEGNAHPTIEGNVCSDNAQVGIAYLGNASGTARRNTCSGNLFGIFAGEQAEPTLEENTCTDNEWVGISYEENSGGVARGNECSGNIVGIYVARTAHPNLGKNNCHDNAQEDILDERLPNSHTGRPAAPRA